MFGFMLLGIAWTMIICIGIHLRNLNRLLRDSLLKFCNRKISHVKFQKIVQFFIVEHQRLVIFVLRNDHSLLSDLLAAFLVSNVPINVYLVTFIFYRSEINDSLLVMIFVLLTQVAGIVCGFYPNTILSNKFHACCDIWPQVQIQTACSWQPASSLKLKILSYYELLNNTHRIALSVGPFGQLIKRNMLDVSYQIFNDISKRFSFYRVLAFTLS